MTSNSHCWAPLQISVLPFDRRCALEMKEEKKKAYEKAMREKAEKAAQGGASDNGGLDENVARRKAAARQKREAGRGDL